MFGVLFGVCALALSASAEDKKPDEKKVEKKDEPRKGTVTGVVAAKGDNFIEVKADGEEKARKYFFPPKDAVANVVKETDLNARVKLDWVFGERFRLVKLEALNKKDDKRPVDKKDEPRKGTVTGVLSAKGENWIEVKADGEEKARRYVPHWRGGAPAAGGGPDKAMVAEIQKLVVNSRLKIEWEFEERARVVKIEVLKKPEEKKEK
jgi:hypothetical protein